MCECVLFFSLEILQAGAVKGLIRCPNAAALGPCLPRLWASQAFAFVGPPGHLSLWAVILMGQHSLWPVSFLTGL